LHPATGPGVHCVSGHLPQRRPQAAPLHPISIPSSEGHPSESSLRRQPYRVTAAVTFLPLPTVLTRAARVLPPTARLLASELLNSSSPSSWREPGLQTACRLGLKTTASPISELIDPRRTPSTLPDSAPLTLSPARRTERAPELRCCSRGKPRSQRALRWMASLHTE